MGAHGYDDQESTQQFGASLPREAALIADAVASLGLLQKQAEQDMPGTSSLAAEIQAVYDMIGPVAVEAEGWRAMFRSGPRNSRDVERVEQPRRGEGAADVGAALRDDY